MDYQHIQNISNGSASINLFSDIGGGITSQLFVQELNILDSMGLDSIDVHINSKGGSVFEGFGIFSAIRNARTHTNTIVDGAALSIAGIILQAGDTRKMVDFGVFMMHDPAFGGRAPESKKERDILKLIKSSLVTIFASSTRKKKASTLDKLMAEETFMSAEEAKAAGLIDEIITTSRKPKNEATIDDIYNMATEPVQDANNADQLLINLEPNNEDMDNVKNHLGLTTEATSEEVLDKVKTLETSIATAEEATKTEATNHEGTVTALNDAEAENVELKKVIATLTVENAIAEGKFDEDSKEDLIKNATEDLAGFKTLAGAVKVTPTALTVTDLLKPEADEPTDGAADRTKWSYSDWATNAGGELLAMQTEKPEEFKKLYDAEFKS